MDENNSSWFDRQLLAEARFLIALILGLFFLWAVGLFAFLALTWGTVGTVLLVLGLVGLLALIGWELWLFWRRFSERGHWSHAP